MKIESLNNKKVKAWLKLKDKKNRDSTNLFLIEGEHLFKEALKKGIVKEIITTTPRADITNIPCYEVNNQIMKKISSQVTSTNIIAVCEKLKPQKISGNVLLLDNLGDPGNLGTIIRSAVAFNIDTIILGLNTVDLYNEKVIRATEGMIFHLNFIRTSILEAISDLKSSGYTIYATDVKDGENLRQITFATKTAIIIGNEGSGINPDIKKLCDKALKIPQNKTCESLNAGVAASIILYEMDKRY